jgi:hypothetical protein
LLPPIINESILHLEVCFFTACYIFILNECILERLPSLPIPHNITGLDGSELREYDLQVLLLRHRVEFAYE